MKKLLLSSSLFFISFFAYSQHEGAAFTATGRAGVATSFVTDYQAIGINPANLGYKTRYETKHFTIGLGEGSYSAYTSAIKKGDFKQSLLDINSVNFDYNQKVQAANNFINQPVALNFDVTFLGFAIQTEKMGGLAFSVTESYSWFSRFSGPMTELMFLGKTSSYFNELELKDGRRVPNDPSQSYHHPDSIARGIRSVNQFTLGQLLAGSTMKNHWYRTYNVAYGREIITTDLLTISGGIGLKYVQGFNYIDAHSRGGRLSAVGAFNPALDIDFGVAANTNPSAVNNTNYQPIGQGYGFDIGVNAVFNEKIKVAMAITNIGSVTYRGNIYRMEDSTLVSISTEGMASYNLFAEAPNLVAGQGFFKWKGEEKLVVSLPTMFRLGGSVKLNDLAEVGIDLVAPINKAAGNIEKPIIAVGGDVYPVRWIKLSTGMNLGGNYTGKANIPFGVMIIAGENGTWEFGVATRDIVTYLSQNKPNYSLAIGLLRFRI
ncbi:MAG: DUF5723 family protein [Cytophagaceae bacterium]